mgnify:CR=1 FL=1
MGTLKKIQLLLFIFTLNTIAASAQSPGDTIYIYDYRSIHDDGIKDPLYQSVLSYQGLVNRSGPRLLVKFNKQDDPFTDSLKAHFPEYEFVEVSTTHELFTMPELRKYCDTAFYYNEHYSLLAENCAVTYAGLENAVMVEDGAMSVFSDFGFSIKADMRTYKPWSTVDKCSQWLLKTAREDTTANKHFYGVAEGNVGRNKAIDFMVQQKMVCFILDSHAEHVGPDHFEKYQEPYLRLYPPFSVSHGWWSKEVKDVEALSTFGHTSANQGENVSFWHKLPVKGDYLQRKSKDTLPAYDPSKTYVLFTFSQGDGMRYCQRTNFEKYVHEDATGQVVSKTTSFGLMHNTLQLEIQPFVPYFHYKQIRDNDLRVWFSGKGYGYANPTTLKENGYLEGYAERSVGFLNRMGMVDLMVNDNKIDRDNNNTVLKDFIDILECKPRSVLLKHELSLGDSEDDEATVINGVPVFADPVMAINTDDGDMIYDEMLDAIAASMNKRQFFYVFLKHPNNVAEVESLLEMMEQDSTFDDLVVLHPDQFIDFYRSAYGLEEYQRPTVPTQQVANLTLYQAGSMPDSLSWEPATDESGITEYAIWFLDRDGHKIGSSLARVPQGTESYDIDDSQSIPLGAESLGVFASWNSGDAFE